MKCKSIRNYFILFFILLFFISCTSMGGKSSDSDASIKKHDDSSSGGLEKTDEIRDIRKEEELKSKKSRNGFGMSKTEKSSRRTSSLPSKKGTSGLKAGFVDDNKQYNRFLSFLNKYQKNADHLPIKVNERIILSLKDMQNKAVPNVNISFYAGKRKLVTSKTYADGSVQFYPGLYSGKTRKYQAKISYNNTRKTVAFNRTGPRSLQVTVETRRKIPQNIPVDILFIFDTTGSMGEEIARLRRTIELIYLNLSAIKAKPSIRLGMVLYKDRGDAYVTRIVPFTKKLEVFQEALNKVSAGGGGDYPEDLQAALHDSMKKMKWNKNGLRLSFIITDAPPQLRYGQDYTYKNAVFDASAGAVKIFSIGTGGLDIRGEYVLRQISQFTRAKYIFLTYGEKGESEGGAPGSVSHHTGANFQTGKLESIIIRFAKEELAHITDVSLESEDEYFQAVKIDDEKKEDTLNKLFDLAINQLIDYSSISIKKKTPVAVLPFSPAHKTKQLRPSAEYFTEQMILSMMKNKTFKMVERKNLQKILGEHSLTMTGLVDPDKAAKVGKLTGADMIVTGAVYKKKNYYEIFIKLLKVETAEVLSVTKTRLDFSLGIE